MQNRFKIEAYPSGQGLQTNSNRKRQAKNWLHVNIGQREVKELRALADCQGITLRTFLELAIRHEKREVARELKIMAWDAPKIPRARRMAIARRNREMARAIGWRFDNFKN